jgi:hypothetical protein
MIERNIRAGAPETEEQERPERTPSRRRGQVPKIAAAVHALRLADRLPPHLRPVERDRRVVEYLAEHGYAGDLPSPSALARYFSAGRNVENGEC